jgi:hypothetical protein
VINKVTKFSTVIFLILASTVLATWASADSLPTVANSNFLLCEHILLGAYKSTLFPEHFIQPVREGRVDPVSEKSVQSNERIKTKDGDLYVFKRTGKSWFSVYSPIPDAFQGDPRWFAAIFGPKVAANFGFHFMSEDMIAAPTAARANNAISELNRKLPQNHKIEITFFETDNKDLDNKTYLTRFLTNSELPLAQAGHLSVHDISYHLTSLAMPKYLLDQTKARIELVLSFSDWVESISEIGPWERYVLTDIATKLIETRASALDIATGNFGKEFFGFKNHWRGYEAWSLEYNVLQYFFKEGSSTFSEFKEAVAKIIYIYGRAWTMSPEYGLEGGNEVDPVKMRGVKNLLSQFLTTQDPRKYSSKSSVLPTDLRRMVDYNVLAIKTAANRKDP